MITDGSDIQPVPGRSARFALPSGQATSTLPGDPRPVRALPGAPPAGSSSPAASAAGSLAPLLERKAAVPADAALFAAPLAERGDPHAVAAMSAALRSYFPTPAGLSRADAVEWEQGATALVGSLAPALLHENVTPTDLHAAVAAMRAQPHDPDSAYSVPGYIASGAGYLIGQACYWLGMPGRASIGAGLLVPNLALCSWRSLNELALRHGAAADMAGSSVPVFIERHLARQSQGFLSETREVFLRNLRQGRQVRNLDARDGVRVLIEQSLPEAIRPACARPAYAAEHAHVPTLLLLSQEPGRLAGMVKSGHFADVHEVAAPDGWTNLDTMRAFVDPDFYRQQVLPHGPATLVGQMLAVTVNTAQRALQVMVEPLTKWLARPVRPAPRAATSAITEV